MLRFLLVRTSRLRVPLTVCACALAAVGAAPARADQSITSAGPLTSISISSFLNCSVRHGGDHNGEFYGDTACGTLVAIGGTLYGPSYIPNSGNPQTAFTPVSQPAVTGSGTSDDPYQIVTVVDAGTTGLQISETDAYVVGDESYRTSVTLSNSGAAAASATLYRAGDCYLADNDSGFGAHDLTNGSVTCVGPDPADPTMPGSRIESWLPLSAGSHSYEAGFADLWTKIEAQQPFDDSCLCGQNIDNAAGLSWTVSVPAHGSVTKSHVMTFSPDGHLPLSTTLAADSATAQPGATDGYTITISNPNPADVSVDAITDRLPSGFSYVLDSTTGETMANPAVSGQTLTWSGPITVPAASNGTAGTITLHFGVNVSNTSGTFFDNAGGSSSAGYTVVGTGDTARVLVTDGSARTLTVTPAGSGAGAVMSTPTGIDCGSTCSGPFEDGSSVTLTATAAAGSTFTGWSGDCTGLAADCTVTMSQARSVTATFALPTHTLTVGRSGTGSGTVTSAPGGISCGATCSAAYDEGTSVTLTATPAAGSTFTGWSGDCTGIGDCTVPIDQARAVTAIFALQTHTLTVDRSGDAPGTVTSAPAGISCGATCSASYDHGTPVTLTATPAAGATFTGWSGDCTGTAACTVTVDRARAVTATFALQTHALTVAKAGSGAGTVTSAPGGISCGPTCAATYGHATAVTLTATAADGSAFTGWSGDCSGTGPCTVTVDRQRAVTATFGLIMPRLTVTRAGTGTGAVTSAPGGISCGATCSAAYALGASVTLTATPAAGSAFTGWSGGCAGAGTCTVTLDQARSVVATFAGPPLLQVPPTVRTRGLFCGVLRHARCSGLTVRTQFGQPGRAVWRFAAFTPALLGRAVGPTRPVVLGSITRQIRTAATPRLVFRLRAGARTKKLFRKVARLHIDTVFVTLTFTDAAGRRQVAVGTVTLRG